MFSKFSDLIPRPLIGTPSYSKVPSNSFKSKLPKLLSSFFFTLWSFFCLFTIRSTFTSWNSLSEYIFWYKIFIGQASQQISVSHFDTMPQFPATRNSLQVPELLDTHFNIYSATSLIECLNCWKWIATVSNRNVPGLNSQFRHDRGISWSPPSHQPKFKVHCYLHPAPRHQTGTCGQCFSNWQIYTRHRKFTYPSKDGNILWRGISHSIQGKLSPPT